MNNKIYELLTLKDIFDSGSRQLNVPDYQRGYSWEEDQRKDLIGDIKEISTQSHRHFTGTVVASQNEGSVVFDLVDGQQRITSLVIFMSCLLRKAKHLGLDSLANDSLLDIEKIYIRSGIDKGNTLYQLQLGPNRDPLFHEVLLEGQAINHKIKNKSDQNIVDAASEFNDVLSTLEKDDLENLYLAVTKKLGFMFYAPKNDAEIGIMFEVINNRGKPLSELEKIKNYLIYYAGRHDVKDLKESVNTNWPLLLESLNTADYTSNDDENRFLRVCWLVFKDHTKSKSYHVYDNLKLICPPDTNSHWEELTKFVNLITNTAKTYANLFNTSSSNLSSNENIILERIALHPANASILPLVVALYSKERDSSIRAEILDLLEKLNFRYYILGIANRNDSGQGELFEMAFDYYHGNFIDQNDQLNEIVTLRRKLIRFIEENANDYKFIKHLTLDKDEAGDYFKWQGLRYFLGSYEDFLLSENKQSSRLNKFMASRDKVSPNDFYHREHIWARREHKIIKDVDNLDINKRRLGNFILLMETINIKVSSERIEKKLEIYFADSKAQPNTLMIHELKNDFNTAKSEIEKSMNVGSRRKNYWCSIYQRFFDIREERLINFAIDRWRVQGIKRAVKNIVIDSKSENNEIFSCKFVDDENINSMNQQNNTL